MERIRWFTVQRNSDFRVDGGRIHTNVQSRRADVSGSGAYEFVVACLVNVDGAHGLQPLGETPRKSDRHMLHDQNGEREFARKTRQNLFQSFGAAG